MLRSPEQDHAPKPLPPPPAFLPPFLSFLPPFFPASNTSAAGGPSSAAVVGRCRAGALGAAAGADGAGRAPASAASMGSTAAPASPRATHCCVTHLVSAASSAVWSDLQGRGSAGSRAECLCRQANVQQWHRSTQPPSPSCDAAHRGSEVPSANAGKKSRACPLRGCTARFSMSKRVAPPCRTGGRRRAQRALSALGVGQQQAGDTGGGEARQAGGQAQGTSRGCRGAPPASAPAVWC